MAFRVTRRAGEAAFTPEYQAATTVRSKAKASTATAMPRMVSAARNGCRMVLRQVSFSTVSGSVVRFSVVAQAFQPVPKYIVGCALRTTSGSQAQLGNQ